MKLDWILPLEKAVFNSGYLKKLKDNGAGENVVIHYSFGKMK
jgi:hypothetical protein